MKPKKCDCGLMLDENWFCVECDKKKCDVCGKESYKVRAGRWIFYCTDNPACKEKELSKIYDNELAPALESGDMPECEVLEHFI